MGYGTNGLTFNTLRDASQKRLDSDKYAKCQTEWEAAHWMQALLGELGELANISKKIDRGDFLLTDVQQDVADELADIQTYLDLLAAYFGIDLGKATVSKFNEVSKRIGSRVYIGPDGDWHLWKE